MVALSRPTVQTAEDQEIQSSDLKWAAVAIQETVEKDYRLEASVYGIEARQVKWTHCRCQNNGKISKIIESHRHSFSRNRPQPALHNRDSGEVVGDYRNGYNELIHRKELVPSGTVSDKHLHT